MTLVFAAIGCTFLITKMILKFTTFAIVIKMSDTPYSVSEIPFPSITLCPDVPEELRKMNYYVIIESIRNGTVSWNDLTMEEYYKYSSAVYCHIHN